MAVEKKRMQQRYGTYTQYLNDKDNLLPNEFASVTSGDPNTEDGSALYFKSGTEEPKRVLQEGDVYSSTEIDALLTAKADSGGIINTNSLKAISGKTAKQFLNAYSYIYDAYGNIISYTWDTVITANSFNIANEDKANKFYICLGSTVTEVQPYAFTPVADNIIAIYVENIKDNVTFSDTTVTSKVTYRQSPLMNFYMLASLAKLHKDKYSLYTKDESKTRFASTSTILFDANKIPIKTISANTISSGFATGNAKLVTAFVSKNVSKIASGAFANCANLTDIYIDNVEGKVTVEASAIPDTVNIHYSDTFNSVDYLMQALIAVNTALSNKLDNSTGAVATTNIANKAVTTNKLADDVKTTINGKANKATTLAGYGINDAYTKTEVDDELAAKADLVQSKNIFDFDKWAKCLQSLSNPVFRGSLDGIDFDKKSITFTGTEAGSYTSGWINNPAEMNIVVKPNTVYTFSWQFTGSSKTQIFLFFNGVNTAETRFSKISTTGSGYLTFTTSEDTSYITIRLDNLEISTATFSEIMIEEGDKKSLYLPYEVAEGVKELAKSTETVISDMTGNTDTALEAKYDASNVETGIGSLTPYTSSTDIVKSADFTYQRVGRVVTVNVNIVFNEGTNSQVMFTNLPYVCKNTVNPRELCVSTAKTTRIWAINKNNTMLNIFSDSSVSYADGETLAFTLSYLIS